MKPLSEYIIESLKKLGSGEEGTVYDLGDGKVKKVFHRGRVPVAYQLLLAATNMGVIEVLPKVYEVGDDYIIRENCTPNTPLCKKYWKDITSKPIPGDRRTIWQLVRDGEDIPRKGFTGEAIDWLLRLKYELSQVCGNNAGLGDLAEKNLGETDDGRIVLMDF